MNEHFFAGWRNVNRPGYFGRRRDQQLAAFDATYGAGNWRLAWVVDGDDGLQAYDFQTACKRFYEESYVAWLTANPTELDFACAFGECIDNAPSNVHSGLDYTIQESYSTHIQDIAMRNALARLGRRFEGPIDQILVIRDPASNGFRFNPGQIPFLDSKRIIQPSLCPAWANQGSVEDFWQSAKFLQVREAK